MTLQLQVPGMACASCAETITQAILKVDAAASVKANLETKAVAVTTQASEAVIRDAIASAGYPVS